VQFIDPGSLLECEHSGCGHDDFNHKTLKTIIILVVAEFFSMHPLPGSASFFAERYSLSELVPTVHFTTLLFPNLPGS
jgi:hypothetical protein